MQADDALLVAQRGIHALLHGPGAAMPLPARRVVAPAPPMPAPRPEAPRRAEYVRFPDLPAAGPAPAMWVCGVCGADNSHGRVDCLVCTVARGPAPVPQPPNPNWICTVCEVENLSDRADCWGCTSARTVAPAARPREVPRALPTQPAPRVAPAAAPRTNWNCTACDVENTPDLVACYFCSAARP